ncbi:protein LURP-one-related 5-like [Silene latifolia]|uniref:protein LURP-one-related 5-like n=1 Tax=Silene latifolia TaxID=37657 RepID=UPI003D7771F3
MNNIVEEENNNGEFFSEKDVNLTACKTSLFSVGDGFNVYNCHGKLVFRVDSYRSEGGDNQGEIVLMDAFGRCLFTVRRKRPSLHNRWDGYIGERTEDSKPIFSVKRSSIYGRSEVNVEVFDNEGEKYQIDGCFEDRSCTIYDATTREIMAEIRRKVDISSKVVMGKDAFSILIKPGFDSAFAMGLVLVLDQINADGDDDVSDELSVPAANGLSIVKSDGLSNGLHVVSDWLNRLDDVSNNKINMAALAISQGPFLLGSTKTVGIAICNRKVNKWMSSSRRETLVQRIGRNVCVAFNCLNIASSIRFSNSHSERVMHAIVPFPPYKTFGNLDQCLVLS